MSILEDEPTVGSNIRRLLPPSAARVIYGGQAFVALPEHEVDEWLADLVDAIEATLNLTRDYGYPPLTTS